MTVASPETHAAAAPAHDALREADTANLPVPPEVIAEARRAYPMHRRRRQCSYRDFESGYIAFWIEQHYVTRS